MASESGRVAVVTDSTASLSADQLVEHEIHVVPLQVIIGATSYEDGTDEAASPELIAQALSDFQPVSTSRPNPERFAQCYRALAEDGFDAVVSVHLSAELSGTVESAKIAAGMVDIDVHVVDSRQIGAATGLVAVAAANERDRGGSVDAVVAAAQAQAADCEVYFYVDTLEHLRRGGRVSTAAALVGHALSVKPILRIDDGRVVSHERVRTAGRALNRLVEIADRASAERKSRVVVAHLSNEQRAAQVADALEERMGERIVGAMPIIEIGAVLGAHVGPGMLAVTVARAPQQP